MIEIMDRFLNVEWREMVTVGPAVIETRQCAVLAHHAFVFYVCMDVWIYMDVCLLLPFFAQVVYLHRSPFKPRKDIAKRGELLSPEYNGKIYYWEEKKTRNCSSSPEKGDKYSLRSRSVYSKSIELYVGRLAITFRIVNNIFSISFFFFRIGKIDKWAINLLFK